VDNTYLSNRWAQSPVDVAWGAGSLVIGVGSRPSDLPSNPNELVIFRVSEDGTTNNSYAPFTAYFPSQPRRDYISYTEPKISYNESRNRYIVAYTDQNTNVRLMSLDQSGYPIDSNGVELAPLNTGIDSFLSPEIVCDTHATNSWNNCYLYIQPSGSSYTSIKEGAAVRIGVLVAADGTLSVPDGVGITRETGAQPALMIDAGTYGRNRTATQPNESAYWMNAAPFPTSSGEDMRFMYDDIGWFKNSTFAGVQNTYVNTYVNNVSYIASAYAPNVSSMDWNERISRFVIVTARW
jgi:hypothetical protein